LCLDFCFVAADGFIAGFCPYVQHVIFYRTLHGCCVATSSEPVHRSHHHNNIKNERITSIRENEPAGFVSSSPEKYGGYSDGAKKLPSLTRLSRRGRAPLGEENHRQSKKKKISSDKTKVNHPVTL
jgi:hypothetical protein